MSNFYYLTAQMLAKSLRTTVAILEDAKAWQLESGKSETEILETGLAPDMFPLKRQIQILSDNAKGIVSRFTGTQNPSYEDNETSFDELVARLQKTLEFVNSFQESDFLETDSKKIVLPFLQGKYQKAQDYLLDYAIPNFYFHKVTAYNILRHLGMPLGKGKYLRDLKLQDLEV